MIANVSNVSTPSSTSFPNKHAHKPVEIKTKECHNKESKKYCVHNKDKDSKIYKKINVSQPLLTFFT